MIFSFAVEYDYPKYHYSQVCRSWRAAAIKNPHLWTKLNIDMDTPEGWIPVLLQRSQGAKLHVTLDEYASHQSVQLILKHLDRIEDLHIDINCRSRIPSILHESIQALSTRELPLRTLVATGNWWTDDEATPPAFPTPLDEDFANIVGRIDLELNSLFEGGV